MMKNILIAIILFGTSTSVFGQNNFRLTQFNLAQPFFNPSTLNFEGPIMVDMVFRNQWLGFEGGPTTFGISGQYEIDQDMAVGLTCFNDQIGIHKATSFQGQYAYRIPLAYQNKVIAFGAGLGLDQKSSNFASIQVNDANDIAFSQNYSKIFFNASVGVSYITPKFYAGLGIPQMFQNNFSGEDRGFNPRRWHYYLTTGAYLGDREYYTFNPHLQIRATKDAPFQANLILRNTFNNNFSFVVGYSSENAIIAGFDVTIAHMVRIGYSANYNLSRLTNLMAWSNEVYLGIAFPYHHNRDEFFERKYLNNRGGFKSNYRKNSIRMKKRH